MIIRFNFRRSCRLLTLEKRDSMRHLEPMKRVRPCKLWDPELQRLFFLPTLPFCLFLLSTIFNKCNYILRGVCFTDLCHKEKPGRTLGPLWICNRSSQLPGAHSGVLRESLSGGWRVFSGSQERISKVKVKAGAPRKKWKWTFLTPFLKFHSSDQPSLWLVSFTPRIHLLSSVNPFGHTQNYADPV